MRTPLNLDQAIYQMLKEIAGANKESIGKAASRLIRQAVSGDSSSSAAATGFPSIPEPEQPAIVTNLDVEILRERLGV